MNCHGAVRMTAGVVEPETDEIREGTAAHWVGQQMLLSRRDGAYPYRIHLEDYLGATAPNGVIITDEMFDAALAYYKAVMEIAGNGLIQQMRIEECIAITTIHKLCWGTPDCWIWDQKTNTLYVFDFKYGHHSVVAYENYQLMAYSVGILDYLTNGNGLSNTLGIQVVNIVSQPRCYDGRGPVRTHRYMNHDLRPYVNIMSQACAASEKEDAVVRSGSHCIGCPARHFCPSALGSVSKIIDYVSSPIPVNPTNEGLAFELMLIETAEKLLKYRKEAIEQEALRRLHDGKVIPGYYLEPGYTHNKWLVDDQTVISTGKLLGVEFSKPGMCTPAQAKQLLERKHIDGSVIDSLMGKQQTSMKLTRESNVRAREIFSQGKI